jgi:predicted ATP-grasp superfamily ATP-dependent carboligase
LVFAKWRSIDLVQGERPWAVDVNARPTNSIIGIARVMQEEIRELILQGFISSDEEYSVLNRS